MSDLEPLRLRAAYIDEPLLIFGNGQTTDHPKDGLFLFGPNSGPTRPKEISVGAIGTKDGLAFLRRWAIRLGGRVEVPPPGKLEKENRIHLSNFPGLEEAFGIFINPADITQYRIDSNNLDQATRTLNQFEAVRSTVDLYIAEIEKHNANEEQGVDVWLLVLPDIIFERCKPLSKRSGMPLLEGDFSKKQRERSNLPLFAGIIDQSDEDIFDDVPDFHRQIKARLLKVGQTSQLLRETTIAPEEFLNSAGYLLRPIQEPATVAWNIATGLYYKTQPEPPWRLANVRKGVCYIGLVFKLIPNDPREYACCAAQMFLNEGDGMVFRGANGPWKTTDYEYHLKGSEAESLIGKALSTFEEKHGSPPKEFFIHGRNTFSNEEWRAFAEAAPEETNVVGVRIKTTTGDTKLFRDGDYPVLRGTAVILDDRNAYLWTSGFVPRLDTYMGPETPNPLFVTILRSTKERPDIETVLADIMSLTKINYNACNYNDSLPVTMRFADKVGDVLTMGSSQDSEKQPLKFYI